MISPIERSDHTDTGGYPVDILALTTFVCVGFYLFFFSLLIRHESFPLNSFPGRMIGISVLAGVDAAARTKFYLYGIVFTGILAIFLLLSLQKIMDTYLPRERFKKERIFLALLSVLGTANLIFGILTKNYEFLFNTYLIGTLLSCLVTLILFRIATENNKPFYMILFTDVSLVITLFLLPIPCIYAILVLIGKPFVISLFTFVAYYLVFFLLLLAVTVFIPWRYPGPGDEKHRRIIVTSLSFLYLYPVSIPLSNELQYFLSQWFSLDPRLISFSILSVLAILCAVFYRIQMHHYPRLGDAQKTIDNFSLPAIIAALALFANYKSGGRFVPFGGNIFEHGITSAVVQQFFDFGKIPYISIITPHGLSDIYFSILYSVINGYQPIDSFLWIWITPVLVAVVAYFFLKEFIEGPAAFLLILLLPLYSIFQWVNFVILIPGILFIRFWKRPELKNYCILLIGILLCFAWRIESGASAFLATVILAIVLFGTIFWKSPIRFFKNYSEYFYATIGIFGICAVFYLALCFISHESPVSAILSLINLYAANDPHGTYPSLYHAYDTNVVIQYAVFPLLGLGMLIFSVWIAITRKKNLTAQLILLAFVAIATLFLSQRGVQRHSLIEGFSDFYFMLLACSIPLLGYRSKRIISIVLLILVLSAGFFVASYPLAFFQKDLSRNHFEFTTWDHHEQRIIANESDFRQVSQLVEYLEGHLQPDQTYFDMSNFLMPYTLLRKELIPASLYTFLQTGEFTQNTIIRQLIHESDHIPIIVTGGWQLDGVPNELRTYRIAEYVYTHYKPIGRVDRFEIWLRNDLDPAPYVDEAVNVTDYLVRFNTSPGFAHDLRYDHRAGEVLLQSGSIDPHVSGFIVSNTSRSLPHSRYTGVTFVYTSDTTGPLSVYYSVNNSPYSENNMTTGYVKKGVRAQEVSVLIPDTISTISDIRIDPPNGSNITLIRGYIYPKTSLLIPGGYIERNFNLQLLPYIWGRSEPSYKTSEGAVQNVIYEGDMVITPSNPAIFSVDTTDLDKTTGNYLFLRLQSDQPSKIFLEYGNETASSLRFDTVVSEKEQDYLVRISAQWDWYAEPITYMSLMPTEPLTLYELAILKGD